MTKLSIIPLLLLCASFATAQKRVLVEKFTSAYCGVCPNASLILKGYQESYPGLIVIKHHKPVTWTNNPLHNPASAVIRSEVGVWGQPLGMVDRKSNGNSVVFTTASWEDKIKAQLGTPHYVNLQMSRGNFDVESRTLGFDIEMIFEELPDADNLRVSVMVVEDKVYGVEQHNYSNDVAGHPLEGMGDIIWNYEHNAVTRTILDEPWGTDSVFPDELVVGKPYVQSFSYEVPEEYVLENMKIVALIAEHDESDIHDRTILNANEFKLNEELDFLNATQEVTDMAFNSSPNPVVDFLNLEFVNAPRAIYILDASGQRIAGYENPSTNMKISVSTYQAGSFIIIIESADGKVISRKFTKV